MVEKEKIRFWVEQVNKEFGLSDKNEESIKFFEKIAPISDVIDGGYYYVWCIVAPDMWGEKYLSVVSWYIMPDKRTVGNFKKIQQEIITLAKDKKVGYIIQGSHLNDKLYDVLKQMDYKTFSMRRNI